MCSCTSGLEGWLSLFLNRNLLPSLGVFLRRPVLVPGRTPSAHSFHQFVTTMVLQEQVQSSSQSCRSRSSAAWSLRTRQDPLRHHTFQILKRCALDALFVTCLRHVVLDESLVLAQVDLLGPRLLLIFVTKMRRTLRCPSSVQPVIALSSFFAGIGPPTAPRKISPDIEAALRFSGIHCIMFSRRACASALSTAGEFITTPFLVRSSATLSKDHVIVVFLE